MGNAKCKMGNRKWVKQNAKCEIENEKIEYG